MDTRVICIVILLLFSLSILSMSSTMTKSLTFDEPNNIYKAHHTVTTLDFGLIPDHTPLPSMINGFPLLFLNLNPVQPTNSTAESSYQFLFVENTNTDEIIFWSKVPTLFLSIILGIIIFLWARELYGNKAGLFALFLYSFSPLILANSMLVTYDIGIALFMFVSVYCFWKYIKNPVKINLLLAGITFGLAQLMKMTALFLIPIYIIMVVVFCVINRKPLLVFTKPLLAIFLLGLLIINAGYLFNGTFTPFLTDYKNHPSLDNIIPEPIRDTSYNLFRTVPVPLPKDYTIGLGANFAHAYYGHTSFLLGEYSQHGWWYYFPIAFLLKNPTPFLLLILASAVLCKYRKDELFIILPIVLILIIFMFNTVNIGIRYILPVFPFLFVFVSRVMNLNELFLTLVIILSVWYLISSVTAYPHYISYFNEVVGDSPHDYLLDSNLDWGQDLKELKHYIDNNNIEKVKLSYCGRDVPEHYGIAYEPLNCKHTNGTLAVSANHLQGICIKERDCLEWLKEYEPTDKIGYSIFIYNV